MQTCGSAIFYQTTRLLKGFSNSAVLIRNKCATNIHVYVMEFKINKNERKHIDL